MTGRLSRITTALAVLMVASVAAVISCLTTHACELVTTHGEKGFTACLLPFTVDGLIRAGSMAALDASRRNHPVPRLAPCSLGAGIVASPRGFLTVTAKLPASRQPASMSGESTENPYWVA